MRDFDGEIPSGAAGAAETMTAPTDAGRFIEVEDGSGRSIKAGEWLKRDDGYWALRMPSPAPLLEALHSVRVYVRNCIDTGHDRTMLGNLYSALDEIDKAIARIHTLEQALSDALEAAEQDGLHGGDSHDDECPVCGLIADATAALGEADHD